MNRHSASDKCDGPTTTAVRLQPIPYQGSKRRLAPRILQYVPRATERLVEPFAGSAAVSIAAASWGLTSRFWINDAHQPLIALWRAILSQPHRVADDYAALWAAQQGCERQFFNRVRDRFNRRHDPADLLFLLARCVKAAVRFNARGQFNNTPDNRRRGTRPEAMRRRIVQTSELLRSRAKLSSWEYRAVLDACTASDFVYLDPPYQGVTGGQDSRYLPKVDHHEFCESLAALNRREIAFALSYDGRSGTKQYGLPLPNRLELTRIELPAGRSAQATLLGRDQSTIESLYLSPALRATCI